MEIKQKDSIKNAVAISYEPASGKAPYLSALSRDSFEASEIVKIAKKHGTPVKRSKALASKLLKSEVGAEIPLDCFKHVAKIFHQIEIVRNRALSNG